MRCVKAVPALAALILASSAHAETLYWVGGLIGWWDNPANWSDVENGPGGAGVPFESDHVRIYADITDGFQVLHRDSSQLYLSVNVKGAGGGSSGLAQLIVGSHTLSAFSCNITAPHAEVNVTGGKIDATNLRVHSDVAASGAPAILNLQSGEIEAFIASVQGTAAAPAMYTQSGGLLDANLFTVASSESGHTAEATLDGGDFMAESLVVGDTNPGRFTQNGGVVLADDVYVGADDAIDSEYIQTDGELIALDFDFGRRNSDADPYNNENGLAWFENDAEIERLTFNGRDGGAPNVLRSEAGGIVDITEAFVESGGARIEQNGETIRIDALHAFPGKVQIETMRRFAKINFAEPFDRADIHVNGGDFYAHGYYGLDNVVRVSGATLLVDSMNAHTFIMEGGAFRNDYTLDGDTGPGFLTVRDALYYDGGSLDANLTLFADAIHQTAPLNLGGSLTTTHSAFRFGDAFPLTMSRWFNEGGAYLNGQTVTVGPFGYVLNHSDAAIYGPGELNVNVIQNQGLIDLAGETSSLPTTASGDVILYNGSSIRALVTKDRFFTFATKLDVAGDLSCRGDLIVRMNPGPGTFNVGDEYTIIEAASVAGVFDRVVLENRDELDFDLVVESRPTEVVVRVIPQVCPGDANGDNAVNFDDLNLLLENWGLLVHPGSRGDVTRNGRVDFADLNVILENWSAVCLP